jgi:hypothetical protein
MQVESIESLAGVWIRRSISWPDGREDTTTRVWWLQGSPDYGDVRIPAPRPSFDGVASLQDCSREQVAWLHQQQGFAGTLQQCQGAWLWKRELDIQPPGGTRDIGRLRFVDNANNVMIEEGVDEPYEEVWERIARGNAVVLRSDDKSNREFFIGVGGHFLYSRTPRAGGLLEISHGLQTGAADQWKISESTLPWREGERPLVHSHLNIMQLAE